MTVMLFVFWTFFIVAYTMGVNPLQWVVSGAKKAKSLAQKENKELEPGFTEAGYRKGYDPHYTRQLEKENNLSVSELTQCGDQDCGECYPKALSPGTGKNLSKSDDLSTDPYAEFDFSSEKIFLLARDWDDRLLSYEEFYWNICAVFDSSGLWYDKESVRANVNDYVTDRYRPKPGATLCRVVTRVDDQEDYYWKVDDGMVYKMTRRLRRAA